METYPIHIKNMVCRRCIMAIEKILTDLHLTPIHVELGCATLPAPLTPAQREALRQMLEQYGFELIDDKRQQIIEQIRTAVIEYVRYDPQPEKSKLSSYICERLHYDYSFLSKLFSEANGITIERYCIAQKIERIKELLIYDELTISQIADQLHYSSVAHLSAQFKRATGMSPSAFKQLKHQPLRPLDKIR